MADLYELFNKYKDQLYKAGGASLEAATSPLQTGKGVIKGLGHLIEGGVGLLADIPQALAPAGYKVPYSSGTIDPNQIDMITGEPIPEWNQRIAKLANVATLGARNQFWDNYAKTRYYDAAAAETISQFLPIHEAKTFLTGESPNIPGAPITPEEYGENITVGAAKFLPFMKGVSKIRSNFARGTAEPLPREFKFKSEKTPEEFLKPEPTREAKLHEINTQINVMRDQLNEATRHNASPETKLGIHEELRKLEDSRQAAMELSPGFFNTLMTEMMEKNPEVIQNKLVQSIQQYINEGKVPDKFGYQIKELIETNDLVGETITDVMVKYGFAPEQMAGMLPMISEAFGSRIAGSGKTLNSLRRASDQFYGDLMKKHPEMVESLAQLRKIAVTGSNPVGWWQAVTNRFHAWSNIIRGAMVSSPVTAARNATSGGLNLGAMLFDQAMVGTWQYLYSQGKSAIHKMGPHGTPETPLTLREAYGSLFNTVNGMQEVMFGGPRSISQWFEDIKSGKIRASGQGLTTGFDAILDLYEAEAPGEMARLRGTPINDLEMVNLFKGGFKGGVKESAKRAGAEFKRGLSNVETVGDGARFGVSVLNTFNTMQEMMWREFYFVNRLRENVKRFGFETPEAMMEAVKSGEGGMIKWFGETPTVEKIQSYLSDPNILKRLEDNIASYRRDNAQAAAGKSLGRTDLEAINIISRKEAAAALKELQAINNSLTAGTPWHEMAPTTSAHVQRLFGGKTEHASAAVSEATDFALRQTFALTPPKGTFGYQLLKTYEAMPFLYALGTPFPRFAINSFNWVMERNPAELGKVFRKGFMDDMVKMAKDPTLITDPTVARKFAQAHTGMALWGLAKVLHENPDLVGPKYYQLKVGNDEDGNPTYADLRPYNPFVQFMFIEHVAKAIYSGQMPNLTDSELTEALLGLRRLNEVPIFALPDIIRQVDASNPGAFIRSVKPILSQYLAGGLIPFRTMLDVAGAFGAKDAVIHKDVSGNEALGPLMNNLPFVREGLPDRPDPFTGRPSAVEHPGIRLVGPNVRSVTKLEQEILKTGIPLNDLLGNFADPEADRLVRQHMGDILNTRLDNGQTLANQLGELVARVTSDKPLAVKKDLLHMLYTELRNMSRDKAMQQNPSAFIEYYVRQQPESIREPLRTQLTPLKESYNRARKY